MTIDKQRLEFGAKAIQVAEKVGGTLGTGESRPFVNKLYAEWQATGQSPKQAAAWLEQRLRNAFVSVGEPPRWVEDEGAWLFHGDQPMVFVSQADVGAGRVPLSPNGVVYLFGIREPVQDGFQVIYRTVVQRRGFSPQEDE